MRITHEVEVEKGSGLEESLPSPIDEEIKIRMVGKKCPSCTLLCRHYARLISSGYWNCTQMQDALRIVLCNKRHTSGECVVDASELRSFIPVIVENVSGDL